MVSWKCSQREPHRYFPSQIRRAHYKFFSICDVAAGNRFPYLHRFRPPRNYFPVSLISLVSFFFRLDAEMTLSQINAFCPGAHPPSFRPHPSPGHSVRTELGIHHTIRITSDPLSLFFSYKLFLFSAIIEFCSIEQSQKACNSYPISAKRITYPLIVTTLKF